MADETLTFEPHNDTRGLLVNDTAPSGYSTIQPWLVSRDTGRLLDFISAAFGGHEVARVPTEDGDIGHAEIRVGDSTLLAFDAQPDWPRSPPACGPRGTASP